MVPDVLALQTPDATHCNALVDGDQVLVRSAHGSGFVCQFDDLPFCLELVDPEKLKTISIVVPRGTAIDVSNLGRSDEHTSELQSLMRISYAVFCLYKTNAPALYSVVVLIALY